MRSYRWYIAATVGLLLFAWLQVLPSFLDFMKPGSYSVLERNQARDRAVQYVAGKWDLQTDSFKEIKVTHLSNDDMNAYLSKYKLVKTYDEKWDSSFPTDLYDVELLTPSGQTFSVSLHLETGKVLAWAKAENNQPPSAAQTISSTDPKAVSAALSWLGKQEGFHSADWEATGEAAVDGSVILQSRKEGLGDAHLKLYVKPDQRLTYRYEPPASFTTDLRAQEKLASKLSLIGYMLPQIILFVLAVIYAAVYSKWTSFRRGIFLAASFFLLYAGFTFNLKPGFRAAAEASGGSLSDSGSQTLLTVNIVILAIQGLLTYFAAVGGDGLWRFMGYRLWPRWQERDYGTSVLRSMKEGYVLAAILLGSQTVLLIVLQLSLGSFSGSDASQSTYNMTYAWLLPLLGWCAGISEELQTRFFGIGLFRRWFTGIARGILRREPSKRSAYWLTVFAMIIPNAIWAFGHVGYAVYPWQTRFIELIVIGFLFGWFMLRFGLMAVIFAHVVFDSTLMGVQMLADGLSSDDIAGLFTFIMPAIVALFIWWLHSRVFRRRIVSTGE